MTSTAFFITMAVCVIGAGLILALYRIAEALERLAASREADQVMRNYRGMGERSDG